MSTTFTVINKYLMAVNSGGKYQRIEANIFELIKAQCIAQAKGRLIKFLPYVQIGVDNAELKELELWRLAFTSDNPPEQVKFDIRLEKLLEEVDFTKPYDKVLAEGIRAQFKAKPKKECTVDADLIIQGELGELDEPK